MSAARTILDLSQLSKLSLKILRFKLKRKVQANRSYNRKLKEGELCNPHSLEELPKTKPSKEENPNHNKE